MTIDVEMYCGWDSGTWNTRFVQIPTETPDDQIEQTAIAAVTRMMANSCSILAFCGVYHIGEPDDD